MAINLSIRWSHPSATSAMVRYARVDNNSNPTYVTVTPNPTVNPTVSVITVATNLPNGQYVVEATPIYADGRNCAAEVKYTPPCDGLISISAAVVSGNIQITWTAPAYIPKARLTINWPNGGNYVDDFSNITTSNVTTVAIPPGNSGNITVLGQSVCDEVSAFYSPYSNQVTVANNTGNNPIPFSAKTGNNINSICNESSLLLYSNGAFTIGNPVYIDSGLTQPLTGYAYMSVDGTTEIYTVNTVTGVVVSDTGQSCSVIIQNGVLTNNYKITNVTGITGFTFPGGGVPSVGIGYSYTGTRIPTGTFTIAVTVSSDIGASGSVRLLKNGILQDCKNVSGNGTYTLGATGFIATDLLVVQTSSGSC